MLTMVMEKEEPTIFFFCLQVYLISDQLSLILATFDFLRTGVNNRKCMYCIVCLFKEVFSWSGGVFLRL